MLAISPFWASPDFAGGLQVPLGGKEISMSDSNGEYPTVIGPDAVFKGELKFDKGVRLLGQFDGEIATKGNLLVAEGAQLQGEVTAGSVRVDGVMKGNLSATGKVHLTASARLEGDLKTTRLEVADGATFTGHLTVGPQNGKAGVTPAPTSAPRTEDKAKPAPAAKK